MSETEGGSAAATVSRRDALKAGTGALVALALGACDSDEAGATGPAADVLADTGAAADTGGTGPDGAGDAGMDTSRPSDTVVSPDSGIPDDAVADAGEDALDTAGPETADDADDADDATGSVDPADPATWAAGGVTAFAATFPDPFEGMAAGPTCVAMCSASLGPCRATAPVRKDITEGRPGLPMRLAFRLVTADTCAPVADAQVEVFHADLSGLYSGETPSSICNGNDPVATSQSYMRGIQTTDASGRVDFDMVYPGWYPGRAPHIHLLVRVGDTNFLTTQLYFDDAMSDGIYRNHPDYVHRPNWDTTNDQDGLIKGADKAAAFTPETMLTDDGALVAWITVGLRASTGEPLCSS